MLVNPAPPHEIIKVYQGEMPMVDFSQSLLMDIDECERLCKGELIIDEEIAGKLANAFHTSKQFWLNLQKQYDESKPEIK